MNKKSKRNQDSSRSKNRAQKKDNGTYAQIDVPWKACCSIIVTVIILQRCEVHVVSPSAVQRVEEVVIPADLHPYARGEDLRQS